MATVTAFCVSTGKVVWEIRTNDDARITSLMLKWSTCPDVRIVVKG